MLIGPQQLSSFVMASILPAVGAFLNRSFGRCGA